jgi:hypothetical protein
MGIFIRTAIHLLARGAGHAARAATQAARAGAQAAAHAAQGIGRVIPSLAQHAPRLFGYRGLPQIVFQPAIRLSGRAIAFQILKKVSKHVVIIGGFSGFGYTVADIVKACQGGAGAPVITDEELADVITSRVLADLAAKEALATVQRDAKEREEKAEALREDLRAKEQRKEDLFQDELRRNETEREERRNQALKQGGKDQAENKGKDEADKGKDETGEKKKDGENCSKKFGCVASSALTSLEEADDHTPTEYLVTIFAIGLLVDGILIGLLIWYVRKHWDLICGEKRNANKNSHSGSASSQSLFQMD